MSAIISQKKEVNTNNFELGFWLNNASGSEFLDYDLPFPNYLYHTHQGHIVIMWKLNGFFGTETSQKYLNDIIARFLFTFKEFKPRRMGHRTGVDIIAEDKAHHNKVNSYELSSFQGLDSLKSFTSINKVSIAQSSCQDLTFLSIKSLAEDLIRSTGFCQYDRLEEFALSNFLTKDKSTLRAKCRSIFWWYEERDFKSNKRIKSTKTEEEIKMTRQMNMIQINERKVEKNRNLVVSIISGLMSNEYKKKNGEWNISKIAKDLKMSRGTVMKYLIID